MHETGGNVSSRIQVWLRICDFPPCRGCGSGHLQKAGKPESPDWPTALHYFIWRGGSLTETSETASLRKQMASDQNRGGQQPPNEVHDVKRWPSAIRTHTR